MPVRNNGPGGYSRASTTRKSKVEPEYPQWAESKMRAIENRRLKELQAVVRDSMPEILAIAADEMDTASESIRKDGYSDMVRRIQNRFRIMRDRLSRRLKTDPPLCGLYRPPPAPRMATQCPGHTRHRHQQGLLHW